MNQIEKIDYLIKEYKKGNYTTNVFCDQFEYIFFREKDGSIPERLYSLLTDYAEIFGRFSPYEEDIKTGALFGEERIKMEFDKMIAELSTLNKAYWYTINDIDYSMVTEMLLQNNTGVDDEIC